MSKTSSKTKKLILNKKNIAPLIAGTGIGASVTALILKNKRKKDESQIKYGESIDSLNKKIKELTTMLEKERKENIKLVEHINKCNRAYIALKKLRPDLQKFATLKSHNLQLLKKLQDY